LRALGPLADLRPGVIQVDEDATYAGVFDQESGQQVVVGCRIGHIGFRRGVGARIIDNACGTNQMGMQGQMGIVMGMRKTKRARA
jgi:hypothetical protein